MKAVAPIVFIAIEEVLISILAVAIEEEDCSCLRSQR